MDASATLSPVFAPVSAPSPMTPTVSTNANISAKLIRSTTAFMVPTKNLLCPLRLLLIIPPLKSNFPGYFQNFCFFSSAPALFRPRFAPLDSALLPPSVRSARLCLRFRPGFAPLGSALLPSPARSARLCLASVPGSLRSALPCFRSPPSVCPALAHAFSHTLARTRTYAE